MSSESSRSNPLASFGQNEWLVDELYQKYLQDPESVDKAWWNFFADYNPDYGPGRTPAREAANGTTTAPAPAPAPAKAPASPAPVAEKPKQPATAVPKGAEEVKLRGAAARTAANMDLSLSVPTATSVRAIPAKLLIDNRIVINNHLKRGRGGKVSFTHLIGFAIVKALKAMPEMNFSYTEVEGKPTLVKPEHVNFGLAIDVQKSNGERQLLVPSIKAADDMDFRQFWMAYEEIVRKARGNKLGVDDFAGTSISLTNPGTIGTVHSVPRLMPGQGTIIGVGAMEYPAEYQGAAPDTLSRLAVSKVMTLTSTYDHRIIQGAQSGDFLRQIHRLLLGEDGFYDEIFEALRIPYEPVRWVQDISASHDDDVAKSARVIELIHAYRVRGHLMAETDPLEYKQRKHPDLDIQSHGLTLWDLEREFATGGFGGRPLMKLREILGVLRDSYCRTVGIEYMHIQNPEERAWIQARVEKPHASPDREEQLNILGRLNTAEAFETFLQTKFVGQKRFSLEGGESLIPLLDSVISDAADEDLDEVVIGMAHRGRLNVLANIVGKSYGQIFTEFEGNIDPRTAHGSGDVKYHLGASGTFVAPGGNTITASVVANPSHLEAVDPVLEGVVRAKQDLLERGEEGFTVLPVLIHGDAAFAGQGVVAETLNLSQLRGYRTGGSIHIVVNNQVGFTTSPASSRSSVYATDVARMIQAPIFHVNGDDPEAVVRVGQLAYEYRQAFRKDVVIDLICYRRRGHNEGDNPAFTQPLMYDLIDAKRSTRKLYTEALIGRGDITVEEAESALRDYQAKLEQAFTEVREAAKHPREDSGELRVPPTEVIKWSHADTPTAITDETLKRIVDTQLNLPEGFTVHPRLSPVLQRRGQMVEQDAIDWSMGEALAIGSLLIDGHPVRFVGQDTRRGTFTQRHAVLVDRMTGEDHTPLKAFNHGTTKFYVYDSLLSEFAALGFEYGYSVVRPDALVAWEAQFGDFVNGAQTIIDEFISSGEQKWGQKSGVVLLLPHGYEGQGPDHSSARIERFLQVCALDNMTVVQPTTPANYFHLLRWQVESGRHKPMVVFTPKSLLRHKKATSKAADFTSGTFQPVIGDTTVDPSKVTKVVLTSGKLYYDLAAGRDASGRDDVAIVRLERLYPFPAEELTAELSRYGAQVELLWAQDEPVNMGPWPYLTLKLAEDPQLLGGRALRRVSRTPNSSPATGSHASHDKELEEIVHEIFG
ncbi:multifunctional oxoglutarate decarboxylase/oxoglutarate dehydrogenase thiamine pyrophosphate-binding subunit/dihydrolipoyllysine-residue succinyltransferase subunit [Nonomuraea sp. NPDC050790]|uniref:multifunctional oxoglutarate decarboxylase/oxoglutarate dehydrogenase thiamine pyrophosphate-binding subunit/dihydrolipoyllysine-residue succinyltransferase subunit n=1 Tax=Nonomuraea sp. NPDC050790 TaxID=3364371 RepID=UPI0037B7827A